MDKNDITGMAAYFCIALTLGAEAAFLCLFIKENADRCHYYSGGWNTGDITRGMIAVLAGYVVRTIIETVVMC